MKGYKLTNQDNTTYGGCRWGENITHETDGKGDLCGPGWIHFYSDPLLAVLLNPIHGSFKSPKLWEIETGKEIKKDHGLKYGATRVTTIKEIPLPEITTTQRIAFAILCAKQVEKDDDWNLWADNWLNNTDRSRATARAAGDAAGDAAWDAARDAAGDAAWDAAWDAARAAAWDAAAAAWAAARAAAGIDLIKTAQEAMKYAEND